MTEKKTTLSVPVAYVPLLEDIRLLKSDGKMLTKNCECGCGTIIPARNKSGEIHYAPHHYWRGKKRIGENRNQHGPKNNNYKGGVTSERGYIKVFCPGHPRASKQGSYVRKHILVMEQFLGRYLQKGEQVHHLNGDKTDNRLENLQLTTIGKHSSFHRNQELKKGKLLFGKDKIKST